MESDSIDRRKRRLDSGKKCKFHIKPKEGWPEIILKVYPDAYHTFDSTHGIGFYMGHVTGRNQTAAEDSYKTVRAFLEKHLFD